MYSWEDLDFVAENVKEGRLCTKIISATVTEDFNTVYSILYIQLRKISCKEGSYNNIELNKIVER